MSGFVSRGFGRRRRTPEQFAARLPPGQHFEPGFPVLTAGPTPSIRSQDWTFAIDGMVASYFVWRGESPVLLVGGGSGVVPLMAMLRHRRRAMPELPMRLVYSVRSADEVIYADELGDDALLTFTRAAPADWSGHTGRIDATMIAAAGDDPALAFVCGSHGFVETASSLLLAAGIDAQRIRTERFGPTS